MTHATLKTVAVLASAFSLVACAGANSVNKHGASKAFCVTSSENIATAQTIGIANEGQDGSLYPVYVAARKPEFWPKSGLYDVELLPTDGVGAHEYMTINPENKTCRMGNHTFPLVIKNVEKGYKEREYDPGSLLRPMDLPKFNAW